MTEKHQYKINKLWFNYEFIKSPFIERSQEVHEPAPKSRKKTYEGEQSTSENETIYLVFAGVD